MILKDLNKNLYYVLYQKYNTKNSSKLIHRLIPKI